jgi:hypothetical protein
LCSFFCFSAINPKDTTTCNSVLCCRVSFYSSVGGHPMGTMTRSSTPLCRLFCCSVKVQSNARQQGAQFHVIIFFCSNVISCKDMMTRSSAFLHHVLFLFKRWRSPWARRQGTQSSAQQQRVKLFIVVYFFYSNVGSPHGHHDEELTSSSLCSFVLML